METLFTILGLHATTDTVLGAEIQALQVVLAVSMPLATGSGVTVAVEFVDVALVTVIFAVLQVDDTITPKVMDEVPVRCLLIVPPPEPRMILPPTVKRPPPVVIAPLLVVCRDRVFAPISQVELPAPVMVKLVSLTILDTLNVKAA